MNIVLKPAGILLILVIIAIAFWMMVSNQAKSVFGPANPDAASGFVQSPTTASGKTRVLPAPAPVAEKPERSATVLDLTRVGATDWVMYGVLPGTLPAKSAVRKNVSTPSIAPLEFVGQGTVASYGNDVSAFKWSDGAGANTMGEDVRNGIVVAGVGSGFRATVMPTVGKKQTLLIWAGGAGVRSKLQVRFSDGSPLNRVGESYKEIGTGDKFAFRSVYSITFTATKPTQRLLLSYLIAEEKTGTKTAPMIESDVSLQAIALN